MDSTYNSMQLMSEIQGQATYKYVNNENYYYINVGGSNAKDLIWGIGLDELAGYGEVAFQVEIADSSNLGVRLIKPIAYNANDSWSQRDDALMNKVKFYGFKNLKNEAKTDSLVGLEIYNTDGTILYTTKRKTLNVIYPYMPKSISTDGSSTSFEQVTNSPTITWNKKGIFIPTGSYFLIDRDVMCSIRTIGVNVTDKNTKLYVGYMACTSRHRRPTSHSTLLSNAVGGIFGEV